MARFSRRRCVDGLEHMCSQGRLFATPITGTSNNKFRPRQRRLRGPTHGKWEESLLQHSSRRFQVAAESKVVHCRYSKSPNRTDERPGTGNDREILISLLGSPVSSVSRLHDIYMYLYISGKVGGWGTGSAHHQYLPIIPLYFLGIINLFSDYSTPSKGSCSSTMRGCCPHQ